jgi:Cu/Ag efflux pump CusA
MRNAIVHSPLNQFQANRKLRAPSDAPPPRVSEAAGGVVVARYGVSTVDVINRIKEKIQALQKGLPPGVKPSTCPRTAGW